MARTPALKRTQAKYLKKYQKSGIVKSYSLKMHKEHDADIIKQLAFVENKNGYIKELIRKDIASKK